jgi:hypothetical protein
MQGYMAPREEAVKGILSCAGLGILDLSKMRLINMFNPFTDHDLDGMLISHPGALTPCR